MAHNTTRRRILAAASQDSLHPPNPSSMDPTTLQKNTRNSTTTKNPDHIKPFYMSNPLSKLNPLHKITQKPSTKNPVYVDTHLQAKAMTVSADFDNTSYSSRLSTIKPKYQLPQFERNESRIEKESIKEKVKKLSGNKESVVVNKKKVQEMVVNEKKNRKDKNNSEEVKDLIEGLDIKRVSVSLNGTGGRRKSLCGSQVELADFLANNGAKIVSVDMPPFMQIHAVDCARKTRDSLEKFTSKTLALTLKKEFDGVYGPAWHCIVGTSFGSFVTHSVGGFLYFSMDQKLYVLLFKTTVQRAD